MDHKNKIPAKGGSASGGKLVIGLGNPGKKYEQTWHNLGFAALELFSTASGISEKKNKDKFKSIIAEGRVGQQKVILAWPQTYMNNSGQAARGLNNFYKIESTDIIVVHDDIDLPLGKIKISQDASAAGHKGVASIIEQLSSKNFVRIRIGIKSARQGRVPTEDYVLQKIGKDDKVMVNQALKNANTALGMILADRAEQVMNQFN